MRKTYRGSAIEVTFNLERCIHVGTCLLRHLREVVLELPSAGIEDRVPASRQSR